MSRIARVPEAATDAEVAALLLPEVRDWFLGSFPGFTPPQRYAVRHLHARENVLISSPTGSGKTLSAFLAAINELAGLAARGELGDHVHVVYVSPLKALNNDIARNLEAPLAGIRAQFEAAGRAAPPIRVGVRTGDTTTSARASQTRRPPHILITTPESLAILLCAPKFRQHLAGVRWVIVDEVHALAESKRGAHLALSLERLARLVTAKGAPEPVRVGLSATISPLDEVARFLFGDRDGFVVDVDRQTVPKAYDLRVVSAVPDLVRTPWHEAQDGVYRLLDGLIDQHRTTLVFTNTRSGTERVVLHLKKRFPGKYSALEEPDEEDEPEDGWGSVPTARPPPEEARATRDLVAAHHGSMSRETRLAVEERLKRGELRCVVTSTSLELGIDIGYVDLVVLVGSPRGIARTLQRVGRSGHKLGAESKGILVATDRDELVECAVIAKAARERRLDAVRMPTAPLDVLCQHLLGLALEGGVTDAEALALAQRAHPYRALSREDLERCLRYLAGHHVDLERKHVYGKIWWDDLTGEFGKRGRMARPIYYQNIGTIVETERAKVYEGGRFVGEIEEAFLENLNGGDIFTLGGSTWAFGHAAGMKAFVHAAPMRKPTVPQWVSEQLPLAHELAVEVGRFRRAVADRLEQDGREATVAWIAAEYPVAPEAASTIADYVADQAAFATVPAEGEVLVEEFVDDELRRVYVFHLAAGRKVNEALARAFARAASRLKTTNARVVVHDYGFAVMLPRKHVLSQSDLKGLFFSDVGPELRAALDGSELLRRRFRHVATRGLLVLRSYRGRENGAGRRQVNSFILYHMLKKIDPEFPLLREVWREVLEDALDLARAEDLCYRMVTRRAKLAVLRGRKSPSPFAIPILVAGAADAVLLEDRREMLRDLHARVREVLAENALRRA